jgi:FtsP/CotA-like multicopper oxidase with cupredoxin domain
VRRGLYGTLVVTPREPPEPAPADPAGTVDTVDTVDIVVPVHTFDGVSVVGDQDRPAAREVPPGNPVRLRLVNTDDLPRRFALTGTGFRVVAIDGRALHRPDTLREVAVRVPAGGRYDLAFEMPEAPVALLVDDDPAGAGLRLAPAGGDGAAPVPQTAGWPALDPLRYGLPAAVPFGPESRFDRDFTLVLDRGLALVDGTPRYAHTVNGRGHPRIPPHLVAEGETVRFTVVNRSLATHPWHLHGHSVLVLARDGVPASGAPLWLDTFDVRPGEVWEVGFTATNPGLWMNHCHNLPHAHQGMMLHLAYVGVTSPYQHH